jgi:hypothetical protein
MCNKIETGIRWRKWRLQRGTRPSMAGPVPIFYARWSAASGKRTVTIVP